MARIEHIKRRLDNWALFSAVSEFMRQYIGIADTSRFVDIQIVDFRTFYADSR